MGRFKLHIDIETYSSVSIADCGLYRYAMSDDFDILLVAYAWDNDPVQIVDLARGEALPYWFIPTLTDPKYIKVAHNATFERVCFSMWLRRHGFRDVKFLDPSQWLCTMVQCSRCGLPMSLAQAGAALGLEQQKMTEGKALIKKFCTPKPRKASSGLFEEPVRNMPGDYPEDWQTFKDYCVRDVEVERQIDRATEWSLFATPAFDNKLYDLDQRINDRGVLLDMELVGQALKADAIQTAKLNEEAMKLTGLDNPNSVSQLKGWLSEQLGVQLDSLTKKDLADMLDATQDPRIRRVLQIRAQLGKTSVSKYEAMRAVAGPDNRARGLMQFYGSRTGRWAGRLIQVQNLPQNHINDLDFARSCLREGDVEMLELGYGNVSDVLSQLIRTAFVAPGSRTLAVCDFSAIEARVLAWLAGEDWVLNVFRDGGDIYCATASQMFHVPVEKHGRNAELRQKGKIAVLALGYGGGVAALDAMGGQRMGMTEQEEKDTVTKWRRANPHIVEFWSDVENAAISCVETRESQKVGTLVFWMHENTLCIVLPSGRTLCYPDAKPAVNRFGSKSIKFHGMDQQTNKWVWIETYGGKLTENITQAVARDCLAHAMLQIEAACIPIVFHVHDEVVCEVPSPDYLTRIKYCFDHGPQWAAGLPLTGAGYVTPYYKKD